MNEPEIPVYDVEELTLEEAILAIASEQERQQAIFTASSERLLQLVA